eukprot:UN27408
MGLDQLFPSKYLERTLKSSGNQFSERLLKLYEMKLFMCL